MLINNHGNTIMDFSPMRIALAQSIHVYSVGGTMTIINDNSIRNTAVYVFYRFFSVVDTFHLSEELVAGDISVHYWTLYAWRIDVSANISPWLVS